MNTMTHLLALPLRRFFLPALLAMAAPICLPTTGLADEEPAEKTQPTQVEVFGEMMEVPAAFKVAKKQSQMLSHEFQASKDDKNARVTMMKASGSVSANVSRWKMQFGKVEKENFKQEEKKIGKFKVVTVDIMDGSYGERVGGGPMFGGKKVQRKNYSMAAAIIMDSSERKFFIKMIGPADVVKANREAFDKMLESLND
ncbi:MAG: hypothetical protein AAF958_00335 [Planctomycetota bacterium]